MSTLSTEQTPRADRASARPRIYADANVPAPLVAFDGIPNRNALLPPDPSGEMGRDQYVQWVNVSLAVFDRSGALLYGPTNGNTIWSGFGGVCETRNDGDPIVQYDQLADRWVIAQFAIPGRTAGYHECVAVSATSDATELPMNSHRRSSMPRETPMASRTGRRKK